MIVLDENLRLKRLQRQISGWYRGSVVTILDLTPLTVVKDDLVARILLTAKSPTFVTINVNHFWKRIEPNDAYCIVCFATEQDDVATLSAPLRNLFSLPNFATKSQRMGKVIRVKPSYIDYYEKRKTIKRIEY